MARQARLSLPGHPHHVLIRGHNRQPIVDDDDDRRTFLALLAATLREHRLALHAYVLMPNHLHLLLTPGSPDGIGHALQSFGRRYVAGFNRRHRRSGSLWEGRYRSHLVGGDDNVLRCMRFIELNPQRAGLDAQDHETAWSSLRHHLGATRDPLITEPAAYWLLGNTPFEREAAYRAWIDEGVSAAEGQRIVEALVGGRPLGDPDYLATVEQLSGRSLARRPRGRPRKVPIKGI